MALGVITGTKLNSKLPVRNGVTIFELLLKVSRLISSIFQLTESEFSVELKIIDF